MGTGRIFPVSPQTSLRANRSPFCFAEAFELCWFKNIHSTSHYKKAQNWFWKLELVYLRSEIHFHALRNGRRPRKYVVDGGVLYSIATLQPSPSVIDFDHVVLFSLFWNCWQVGSTFELDFSPKTLFPFVSDFALVKGDKFRKNESEAHGFYSENCISNLLSFLLPILNLASSEQAGKSLEMRGFLKRNWKWNNTRKTISDKIGWRFEWNWKETQDSRLRSMSRSL